jgi:hypothetical protein
MVVRQEDAEKGIYPSIASFSTHTPPRIGQSLTVRRGWCYLGIKVVGVGEYEDGCPYVVAVPNGCFAEKAFKEIDSGIVHNPLTDEEEE